MVRTTDWIAKALLPFFGVTVTRSWTEEKREEEAEPLTSYGSIRREIGTALSRANLSHERRSEIFHAVDIDQIPPLGDGTLSSSHALHESLQEMWAHLCNRSPLLDLDWETVYGALYMTMVFRHLPGLERDDTTFAVIAELVVWVDPELSISALIDHLQQEIALVRSDGPVRGLVTSTDALRPLRGSSKTREMWAERAKAGRIPSRWPLPPAARDRSPSLFCPPCRRFKSGFRNRRPAYRC